MDLVGELVRKSGGQLKGLRPGLFEKKELVQEMPRPANIFIRQFLATQGEFSTQTFRSPGWICSGEGGWWTRMVDFVLEELKDSLTQSGLTIPVLATRRGVVQSLHNFFAMLEKYNPDSCTFFTPAGELGFALHEMQAVSGLSLGKMPYEEFIPTTEELSLLKVAHPEICATFWELMCHFHICAQVFGMRGGGIMHTTWADYLFQNLNRKDVAVSRVAVISRKDAKARITASSATYKTEHAEDDFEAGAEFESFHYQATVPISDTALLAGFFMIWLKRCVVPSRPIEAILAEVVYPAVLLAHGRPVSLLTAMVGCIQNGLRVLTSELLSASGVKATKKKAGKAPQPRVPMPYTYLVAWFVLHCPSLMTGVHEGDDAYTPFVQRLESATWTSSYIVRARQLLSREDKYRVFCCAPNFDGADVKDARFMDLLFEGSSSLEEGTFSWLLMIRLGYLVYRSREKCVIEPYMPSRFARQFGYDQLYVGNPNPALAQIGNLCEGARAWYFFSAGGTHAQFTLPHSSPGCSAVMDFRQWFAEASQIPEYDVYTSCINEIRELYRSRSGSASTRLPGMEEYLSCEQEATGAVEAPKDLSTVEPSEEEVPTGIEEGKPIDDPPEEKTTEAIPAEESVPTPRSLRSGKKALSAAEQSEYDRRIRKRIPVMAKNSKRAKIMGDAMKSALVGRFTDGEDEMPQSIPSVPEDDGAEEGPSSEVAPTRVQDDHTDPIYPTLPPPRSGALKKSIDELERWMQTIIGMISVEGASLEDCKSILSQCLDDIKAKGDASWTEHCQGGITLLMAELTAFRELQRANLDSEVEPALSLAIISRAHHPGNLRKELSDKIARISTLRKRHSKAYAKIKRVASDIRDIEETIARLEAELDQKKAQLAHYEDVRKELEHKSGQIYTKFCRTLHAAEQTRKDIVATLPIEAELRKEIEEQVQAAHREKLSAFKSRLKTLKLMKPDV